jgi:serine/threonine-protein kinase
MIPEADMDAARWARVQEVFHEAADLPQDDQQAVIDRACPGDPDLAARVRQMLDADLRPSAMLDRGVDEAARRLLDGSDALPFTQVGRYVLTRRLGEGGMGVVHLAERPDLGILVAIKILRDASVSPVRRERFSAEQRTLALLRHRSIAKLYDADTLHDGTPWFAMEYVEGVALDEYCRSNASTLKERLQIFREVCEAVQYAHQHLVIHRDIKPSNILVTADGTVKLLDFGIAKQLDSVERRSG